MCPKSEDYIINVCTDMDNHKWISGQQIEAFSTFRGYLKSVCKRELYGNHNHGSKVVTNGVDWGIWWVGGPLMGARTMAIICNLSYQAHIYMYFARLLNSTLGGGKFLPYGLWSQKGERTYKKRE